MAPKRPSKLRLIAALMIMAVLGSGAFLEAKPAVGDSIQSWFRTWSGDGQAPTDPPTGPTPSRTTTPAKSATTKPPPAPAAAVSHFSVDKNAKQPFAVDGMKGFKPQAKITSITASDYSLKISLEVNYDPQNDDVTNESHPNYASMQIDSDQDRHYVAPYRTTFSDKKSGMMRGTLWFPLFISGKYTLYVLRDSHVVGLNKTSAQVMRGDVYEENGAVLRHYETPAGVIVNMAAAGRVTDPSRTCVYVGSKQDKVAPVKASWSLKAKLHDQYFWIGELTFPPGTHGLISFDCDAYVYTANV